MSERKIYYLMDGRAMEDVDDALVLETCTSLEEAKAHFHDFGGDTCIVDEDWELVDCLLWHEKDEK